VTPLRRSPLDVLGRRWPTVVATALLVTLLVTGASLGLPKTWSSDVVLRLTPQTVDLSLDPTVNAQQEDPARQLATETTMTLSDAVIGPAARQLGVATDDLRRHVNVTPSKDADTFVVTATGPTAQRAQHVATVVSELQVRVSLGQGQARLLAVAQALEPQIASAERTAADPNAGPDVRQAAGAQVRSLTIRRTQLLAQRDIRQPTVEIATAAELPQAPAGLRLPQAVLLGGVAGLLLGAAIAFLRELTDRRLRDVRQLSDALDGVPALLVPARRSQGGARRRRTAANADAMSRLGAALTGADAVSVLLTTVTVEEHDPGLVLELALTLACAGLRTVTVDACRSGDGVTALLDLDDDSRHTAWSPSGTTTGGPPASSLRQGSPSVAVWTTDTERLCVLPAGWRDGSTDLGHSDLVALLPVLLAEADVVLVDAPAIGTAEAMAAARAVDAVVIGTSIGARGTRLRDIAGTAELLRLVSVRPRVALALGATRRSALRGEAPIVRAVRPEGRAATPRAAAPAVENPTVTSSRLAPSPSPRRSHPNGAVDQPHDVDRGILAMPPGLEPRGKS